MKVNLFPFQKIALAKLRQNIDTASSNYKATHTPQIVSYTAPTGAGKTITSAALIESVYNGDGFYPEQVDAIFVWLSDSPQLNEQSRIKIETKADKCYGRCTTISDETFDMEVLEDGRIYFLNTQKLSKSSNLTKKADTRQYTIWETLANTVREKADRLYFIIDEAHRGAHSNRELANATTIMQKFLKGSKPDILPPMPVVMGMTATAERFHRLAENIQSTTHYVETTADEVRASGLLKERIHIRYPEESGNEMSVLQAAADEWKNKWDHWTQYCYEQHYAYVNPVFVIQVQNGSGKRISNTDLDECLRTIEDRLGERFSEGQVVHAFAEGTAPLVVNGLTVPYVEPSRIADDKRIKIVFFKEALSTGWDCPRAETMMSFRHAEDYTYIAQLLGRMVRTPTQQRILVDDTLNDVHLYLPYFAQETVDRVVEALRSSEGATIPADIEAEEIGSSSYSTLTLTPTLTEPSRPHGQRVSAEPKEQMHFDYDASGQQGGSATNISPTSGNYSRVSDDDGSCTLAEDEGQDATTAVTPPPSATNTPATTVTSPLPQIDRCGIVKAINDTGLLTYHVRKVRIADGLKSLISLSRLLTQTGIDSDILKKITADIVGIIHKHIEILKEKGFYDSYAESVLQFKLNTRVFDIFGAAVPDEETQGNFESSDADIERHFRAAEARLGNEGIANAYCNQYCQDFDVLEKKVDVNPLEVISSNKGIVK